MTDASPPLETLAPPAGQRSRAAAPAPPTRCPAQPPPGSTGAQAQPEVRPAGPRQPRPRAPLPREPSARNAGLAELVARLVAWIRRHPSAVLTVAGVILFTLAALTVVHHELGPAPRSPGPPASGRPRGSGDPTPTPRAATARSTRRSAAPLGSAGFDELVAVLVKDRRLRAPRPTPSVNRALLASALLASEYGRPSDRPTEVLADELVAGLGSEQPPEDLAAARVLLRLARGDRAGAEAAARALGLATGQTPLIRFVEARRLSRNGEEAAALDPAGPRRRRARPFRWGGCWRGSCRWTGESPTARWPSPARCCAIRPATRWPCSCSWRRTRRAGGKPPRRGGGADQPGLQGGRDPHPHPGHRLPPGSGADPAPGGHAAGPP